MLRALRPALPLLAGLASLATAGAVSAQETNQASKRIVLSGNAPAACIISTPSGGSGVNASFTSQSIGGGQIAIAQLVDPVSSTALASSIAIDLPVICNTSHVLTVRSTNGGLARQGAAAPAGNGFSSFETYRVSVDWAGQALTQASDAGTARVAVTSAMQGTARVGFATTAGGQPLVAGTYTDSLVIELAPTS